MSDGQWVRQTLDGNPAAYEQLVRQWSARVLAVCHARVGRADVAEELAQETLYRGYRALPTLAEPEKFGPWLCGIANRVCLDWLKSKQNRTTVTFNALSEDLDPEDFPAPHDSGPGDPEHDEQLRVLMSEVNKLPARHREALMLYYYEDCTYGDLAKLLGCSVATINARLTQARQMLRQKLVKEERNLTPSPPGGRGMG